MCVRVCVCVCACVPMAVNVNVQMVGQENIFNNTFSKMLVTSNVANNSSLVLTRSLSILRK